jgi:hypothetical protein
MKKAHSFIVILLALTGLILFAARRTGGGAAPSSPPNPSPEKKPTFTGEFDFHETLQYVQNGVHDLDLGANIPFEISWNENVGAWAIKGSAKDAKGTTVATGPYGSKCQGSLKGKIDLDVWVTVEKLKACLFKLNINQAWEGSKWTCRVAKIPPYQVEYPAFELNHVFDYDAGPGPHSKAVESGIMKGHLYLQLKKFSGTLIDGCGVMY